MLILGIYCSNLEITKKFYVDLFGFSTKYERTEEAFAYFTRHGSDIMAEGLNSDSRNWLYAELVKPYGLQTWALLRTAIRF